MNFGRLRGTEVLTVSCVEETVFGAFLFERFGSLASELRSQTERVLAQGATEKGTKES